MPTTPRRPQLTLDLRRPGGRKGRSGRRPAPGRPRVKHLPRPVHRHAYPVHVTLRVRDGVWNLRSPAVFPHVRTALTAGAERFGFRLVEWSVQTNHLHLLAEANDRRALTRGLKGLGVRIAKKVNRLMGTKGAIFADRYHARALRTPREVRNALLYVLNNFRRHARRLLASASGVAPNRFDPAPPPGRWPFDRCSTAFYFNGWKFWANDGQHLPFPPGLRESRLPATLPESWLLRTGWWEKHGYLHPLEVPGPAN